MYINVSDNTVVLLFKMDLLNKRKCNNNVEIVESIEAERSYYFKMK